MACNELAERIIRVAKYEDEHYGPGACFRTMAAALRVAMHEMTPLQQERVYWELRRDMDLDLVAAFRDAEQRDAEGDR